jgi:hypothetical protein
MRKLFVIFLFAFSASAQKVNSLQNDNLVVSWEKNIDPTKIWITLSQFNDENISFFNLFQMCKFGEGDYLKFPNNSGYYFLSICYDMKVQYNEIIYYSKNPENEKLTFDLFKKRGELFCKMNSSQYINLNKTIELYKIDYDLIKKNARKKIND